MNYPATMQGSPEVIWKPLDGSQVLALSCPCNHILYEGTRGPGKGLPLSEPVYTPSGPVPIGSITEGDLVCDPAGGTSKVIGVYPQGIRPVYEIEFDDGSIARCDDQHIWTLHLQDGNNRGLRNYSMAEVIRRHRETRIRQHVPTLSRLDTVTCDLPIDPYLFGLLLGDGSFTQQGSFCTVDQELADEVLRWDFKQWADDKRPSARTVRNFGFPLNIREACKVLGLWSKLAHEKTVPSLFLNSDSGSRLALLQGLMDTDGTADRRKGWPTFASASRELSKAVQYLARSLGARATLTERTSACNGKQGRISYSVYIQTGGKFNPFRLKRKADLVKSYQHKNLWRRIVDIRELQPQETVCIKLNSKSGLFITRDFVVTHNTDAQIMYFRRFVGIGYGQFWRGVIFDREYKNLDDLISKSKRWYRQFGDGAKFVSSTSQLKWVWPTGEELWFRVMKTEQDYWNYHGHEFPFIGWNELTKQPNSNMYDMAMSLNRTSFVPELHSPINHKTGKMDLLPEVPLVVFSTTNPYGVGHNWVKQRFIDPAPPGQVVKITRDVFNPRTQQREPITKTQVRLFGSYKENIYLSPEYILELEGITDPNKRAAWLWGDWDITSGGMFDDVWSSQFNIVDPFQVPPDWRMFRSFDWGSSKPFSVGWWAESNGDDIQMPDGSWKSTVRGDLFRVAEWYGWNGVPNTGLRMLATHIAKGIVERELKMGYYGRVSPGPADNSINDVENGVCIAQDMAKAVKVNGRSYKGVQWARSNKGPGSRKNGWEKLRVAIYNAQPDGGPREEPGLFVFRTCQDGFIRTVPTIPRCMKDPDDVDTDAEDHVADEVRYVILSYGDRFASGSTTGHF